MIAVSHQHECIAEHFTVIDDQIIIDYDEIQKLNNYKIKIKFILDDFASSFMIDFMAFKYDLPHDYITHECEITCDKCDNVISKNAIDFNKEHENEYIGSVSVKNIANPDHVLKQELTNGSKKHKELKI